MPKAKILRSIDDEEVYYSVYWSRLAEADKYQIIGSVPAEPGMYELYYMDNNDRLRLMIVSLVWYGGLRSRLRKMTDPTLTTDRLRRQILESYRCYYRYALSYSLADMQDILYFFESRYRPGASDVQHSGRFEEIYLEEHSEDKIVTV